MEKDRSRKGSVDPDIKGLLALINSDKRYETTSSCSGRIVLLNIPKIGDKRRAAWLYVTHTVADPQAISRILQQQQAPVYFLQEPVILHVNCVSLDAANELLALAKRYGFKIGGIISLKHYSVELRGTERMETLLTSDLPPRYIKQLVCEANKKLQRTKEKIKRLSAAFCETVSARC